MRLNTYLLRIFILAISLTIPLLACTQERKAKVNKKEVVEKEGGEAKALRNKSRRAKGKQQPQTEEELRAARRAERRTKQGKQAQQPSQGKQAKAKQGKAKAKQTARKGEKSTSKDRKATAVKGKRPATKEKKRARKPAPTASERRFIALKTNVPFDALAVQNLALEIEVHKQVTIDFPVMWSIGDIEREHGLRTIAFQPEGRWWLKSAAEGGHFFGLHTHFAWFNLKWEDDRYESQKRPLMGVGLSYGYRLPMGKHWAAEFNLGVGYANMKYNTYYNIENGALIDTRIRNYWGITRAGISLVYRF